MSVPQAIVGTFSPNGIFAPFLYQCGVGSVVSVVNVWSEPLLVPPALVAEILKW